MNPQQKNRLIAVVCLSVIVVSCAWIYFTQIKDALHNKGLHQHIGEVMAEQAASALGPKGKIVAIAIDTKDWPELKVQLQAFKAKLKKLGDYEVRDYEMDTKDQPKYGVGSGLSGRRYVRTVKKNLNAGLFVSFIGAPKLSPEEIAELGTKPKLIVESRSGDNLPALFENKLIVSAVVARFQFPAAGPEKPRTIEEWFHKRYQVVTAGYDVRHGAKFQEGWPTLLYNGHYLPAEKSKTFYTVASGAMVFFVVPQVCRKFIALDQ